MNSLMKQNSGFFLLTLFFLIVGAGYMLSHIHGDEILGINAMHQPAADFYFKYITHLGDGLFFGFVLLIFLCFVSYYQAIVGTSIFVVSTLVVQIAKRLIFDDQYRPVKYFFGRHQLNLVEGVEVHHFNSFPSGHTGSAFALAMFLTLYTRNKMYSVLYFIIALNVAISRMYLSQHFLRDVYAGAILGIISSLMVFFVFENFISIDAHSKLHHRLWGNK